MSFPTFLSRTAHLVRCIVPGRRRIPDRLDGEADARLNTGFEERLRQILALCTANRTRFLVRRERTLAEARVLYAQAKTETDVLVELRKRLGEPAHTLAIQLLFLGAVLLAIASDTILLREMTVMLGVTDPALQWIVALSLILSPSVTFNLSYAPWLAGI